MITVHVGLHKTGTTSIQAALGTAKGHIRRRQAYLRWTDLFVTDGTINEAGAPAVQRLSARGWHAVVSSEGALGPMSTVYPDAAPVVARLDELFTPTGLQVIVYVRPQHEWAASAYTQYVKEGGTAHPRDYVTTLMQQPHLRYTELARVMRDSIGTGQLVIRPYRAGMDAVQDFFDVAGLGEVPPYLGTLRVNESLSADSVSALRQANEIGRPIGVTPASSTGSGRLSPLPEDSQVALHELFRADWAELSEFVGQLPGHEPTEFRAVLDGAENWTPLPYVEAPAQGAAPASPAAPEAEREIPFAERMAARRRRWEFQLRHGPRQTLLKAMMRKG